MRRCVIHYSLLVLIALFFGVPGALAQVSVQQGGTITPNLVPYWITQGVIGGDVTAADSPVTSFGVTASGSAGICANSARETASGWQSLCLGMVSGVPTISSQNYGTAAAQNLQFIINGVTLTLPSGGGTLPTIAGSSPYPVNDLLNFNNASGLIGDSGLQASSGSITSGSWAATAIPVLYGGTGAISASAARTNLGLGSIATQNSSAVSVTGGTITGMPTPVNPSDVAIKSYVDSTATGLNILAQSMLATATTLPNSPTYSNGTSGVGATLTAGTNTTLTVDGTSAPLNTVVLVKNQASAFQNGIYTVTTAGSGSAPWVLTRATYFDQASEMKAGSYTFITAGATNTNSSWVLQSSVTTVGTDALTFNQFSSSSNVVLTLGGLTGNITLGNGLTTSGSSIATSLLSGNGIGITGTTPLTITAVTPPGGRLTLVSGQPEMTVDTTSQNLYYAPDTGNNCPIWNGTSWINYQFTSSTSDQVGLTLALGGSSSWPAGTIFDVFCIDNNGTIQLATRAWDSSMLPTTPQISSPGNATITTGTNTATWTNASAAFDGTLSKTIAQSAITNNNSTADLNNCLGQDLGANNAQVLYKVALTEPTDGSFRGDDPTTMVTSTYGSNDDTNWQRLDPNRNILSTAATYGNTYTYYINKLDATPYRYFRVCFTGTGTSNNLHIAQIQFFTYTAPSTRRLTRYNGILVNDATMTGRISSSSTVSVPQYEATYLGSFETDAGTAGQITADFGYGINRVMDIWNYYHRQRVTLIAGIPATNSALPASATQNYTLTWPAWQDWQGVQSSTSYSAQVLVGYNGDTVRGLFSRAWYINANPNQHDSYEFGIGVDTTISFSGSEGGLTDDDIAAGSAVGSFGNTTVTIPPFFGTHTLYGIEKLTYQPAGTVQVFENIGNTALYVHTYY